MRGSGNSSLSFWTPFDSVTTSISRQIAFSISISWLRQEDVSAYATIGTTLIGGLEVISGDIDIFTPASAFQYFTESERLISCTVERTLLEPLGGFALAQGDAIFDNTDLRFTPEYNSTIGTALLPNRPLRFRLGFNVDGVDRKLTMIEGLTDLPKENKVSRQMSVHFWDYMKFISEIPLESTVYENVTADQIIEDILIDAGFGSSQYDLDVGLNSIAFAWFSKGTKAGDAIRKLCEAEEANFFQDEDGIMRFKNRDTYRVAPATTVQWTINSDDIITWENMENSRVYNRVIVKAHPRSVKGTAEIWRDGVVEEVPAGGSITIWANYNDPVTSFVTPAENTDYEANTASDGSGSDISSDITVTATNFTTATKLVIENANAAVAYITLLRLRGTPATIDYAIEEIYQDDTSIAKYGEKQLEVENDFIDDRDFAIYLTRALVNKYTDPRARIRLTVQGIPQLQLLDKVQVYDQDVSTYTNYRVMKITNILSDSDFTQTLELREIGANESAAWAVVGVSSVEGLDVLGV